MRILITRPEPDATQMAQALMPLGFSCIINPVLAVSPLPFRETIPDKAIVLITSKQAIPALVSLGLHDRLILTVGAQTAQSLVSLGFPQTQAAGETVQELLDFLQSHFSKDQHFFYLSGRDVSCDVPSALAHQGYVCQRTVVYETSFLPLSPTTQMAFKNKEIDGVIFMSLNTVKAFVQSLKDACVPHQVLRSTSAFALSPPIAAALERQPWFRVHTALAPTVRSLTKTLVETQESTHG